MSRIKLYLFISEMLKFFEVIYMVEKYRSEIGNYLKNIRKNKNITAKALGENLKYSQSHIVVLKMVLKRYHHFYTVLFKFYF